MLLAPPNNIPIHHRRAVLFPVASDSRFAVGHRTILRPGGLHPEIGNAIRPRGAELLPYFRVLGVLRNPNKDCVHVQLQPRPQNVQRDLSARLVSPRQPIRRRDFDLAKIRIDYPEFAAPVF